MPSRTLACAFALCSAAFPLGCSKAAAPAHRADEPPISARIRVPSHPFRDRAEPRNLDAIPKGQMRACRRLEHSDLLWRQIEFSRESIGRRPNAEPLLQLALGGGDLRGPKGCVSGQAEEARRVAERLHDRVAYDPRRVGRK